MAVLSFSPEALSPKLAPPEPREPHETRESLASARRAGLRYVDATTTQGLRRIRREGGFVYVDERGRRVRDQVTLDRVRKLVIPPAWEDVWICPIANGHLQAVGRDARGRKQYRYHARWREVRDATKYHKMIAFADALPRIRAACERDLARPGLPREKVLATAVRLLELTHIRIGNEEYTRENGSYGLTTLRDRHLHIEGAEVSFHFRGKSGKMRDVGVRDRRLARILAKCSELPGHELFHYMEPGGAVRTIDSGDVNGYLHAIAGDQFTAKDFRTWAGTVLAAITLRALTPCAVRRQANRNVVDCIKSVAAHLGNTPAVCRRCYVHPAILDAYLDGTLAPGAARGQAARSQALGRDDESFVRAVLERAARMTPATRLAQNLRASLRAVRRAGTPAASCPRGRRHLTDARSHAPSAPPSTRASAGARRGEPRPSRAPSPAR